MMDAPPADQVKQEAILTAALAVMCQYGYRRTSMGDIAQAAGMSRPALYQHFQGKEDIARRMVEVYFDTAARAVSQALAGTGSVEDLLARGLAAKTGPMVRDMLDSPHGAELLDVKDSHAREVVAAGTARLTGVFADWLAREAAAGRVRLDGTAEEVAVLILGALDGIKRPPYAQFVEARERLAHVLGRGLATGS
ncbi:MULTISPECIES: TetR/AcrR family transcriptional regulator [Mameliella]|uniref:Transcriptional regulator, TetR family n=1 Tax=Mameliella alba TaxID=561184 RepID=A0A0B3RTB1_9RHOB|nr:MULTISPECIES: TetR/AcrR family transcriptional regulator [Mameliella]KHQ49978.1 Transcriptional regulator, TetR family [Mameliella alba]MCR9275031.1 TetR/AcrR family transcriptional regulator [Paracoccaceae bacterium]OWV52652.1 TetR family transcriptional regulator [Mameliella alba]